MTWALASVQWGGEQITMLDLVKQQRCIFDNGQDDELSFYLDAAGTAAEQYCNTVLYSQSVTERIARSRSPIALRHWPVSALTEVIEDGKDVTSEWEFFVSEGVAWATKSRSNNYPADVFEQLNITYTAGFEIVPADLANVISRQAWMYSEQTTGPVKKESIVGVGSIEYVTDMAEGGAFSPAYAATLNLYRRFYV